MPNNIANKLVVNANTQKEIYDFLYAIIGVERGEVLKNRTPRIQYLVLIQQNSVLLYL